MKKIFDRSIFILNLVSLALCGLALVDFILHPLAPDFIYHSPIFRAITMLVFTPLTLLVGLLIIRRVPGNSVGPLLILWAGTVAYGAIRKDIGAVPFTLFALYEIAIGWPALFLMIIHFPNGIVYPPAAAPWIYRSLVIGIPTAILLFMSNISLPVAAVNPFYLPALQNSYNLLNGLMFLIFSPLLVLTPVSPVLRYRVGNSQERAQIKWLALFGVIFFAWSMLMLVVYPLLTGGKLMHREDTLPSLLFFTFVELAPPVAIGIAVLRYRLWDIDVIIRRTLVYSILTATLTLVYFSSVILLQTLAQLITGQRESPVVTVLSTLAIVALFTPFRRRIQIFIDRRFYRRKYDAERVLHDFSTTLRDEVDLDHMKNSILRIAELTMQPHHVSLWLYKSDFKPGENKAENRSSQSLS